MPPGSPTDRVAEADGPTSPSGDSITHLTAPTTSRMPHAAMTTLASPSAPLAALMTLASTYAPHVAPTTPPAASSMAPISPPATQLVPRMLSAGAVPVSPVVHPHLMRTRGAAGFCNPSSISPPLSLPS
jgi:hypothetical protein